MITKKYICAVSVIAMFAVSAAVASAPATGETVAKEHTVYTAAQNAGAANATVDATSGIAGVTYVNRVVNRAGNAAQLAEKHAAAAGSAALSAQESADLAAESAQAANDALAGKLDASKYGYIPTNENGTGSALIWVE